MLAKRISEILNKILEPVSRYLNYCGAFFLLILMALVIVHIAGRYFLNRPVEGAVELIELLMIFIVFLGFGYVAVRKMNVAIDFFVQMLPEKIKNAIEVVTCLLSIVIVTLITWQALVHLKVLFSSGQATGVIQIPHYPFMILLFVGYLVFDLVLIQNLFENIYRIFKE
ncbi:MAG: TRAP transporter small permease [Deltaproteobacteria bacterium]|nr:TRAP transporter small permease [Deltaproteobacteria bacterium]